jgi:hypothetical protein
VSEREANVVGKFRLGWFLNFVADEWNGNWGDGGRDGRGRGRERAAGLGLGRSSLQPARPAELKSLGSRSATG